LENCLDTSSSFLKLLFPEVLDEDNDLIDNDFDEFFTLLPQILLDLRS